MKNYFNFLRHCTFFGLTGLVLMACRVTGDEADATAKTTGADSRAQTTMKDAATDTVGEGTTPRIIFLTYSIKKETGQGEFTIELIDEIVTEGKIKMDKGAMLPPKVGDLRCVALNANRQPVSDLIIPNPLNETVEFVSEDGNLSKKEIPLDSALFSVRVQLSPTTKYIAIERIDTPDKYSAPLILTQIK